ncbi:mechanosensitive ion channel family protein [Flavobacterium arcticum]|uniref:Mechanosensitive ion channel family protein n=1 Tax=Flavobacterium arcticum TaxID=1784713 RepID=A0A345HDC0_9FLAO|nr:mechanosensitive ion channel family protein [Flavobacterium arcticum]AXG74580.1 mechanosensitive ion channel family protein [Flavobacterium arcticum]KAF2512300.1 mechanosensitive ion channel [Flavobacterium arcticum]
MKNIFRTLIAIILLISTINVTAQADTIAIKNDSLTSVNINQYKEKLVVLEQQRIADSIKKIGLQKQLESLQTTDNFKKEELQKQLSDLNNREAQRLAEKKAKINSLRATAKGYPVTGFFNDTLFTLYSKLGSFSAHDRAKAISERIHVLGENYSFIADSIKIVDAETTTDIIIGESIIMSVCENDAIWNNTSQHELAKSYSIIIGSAVVHYKDETSFITLAKEIGLAILVLLVLIVIIRYSGKLFKWTEQKVKEQEGKRIKGITIKNYNLFDAQRQIRILLMLNTLIKWLVILILIYIALPILFGIFPWTQHFAEALFSYILTPVKKIAFGFWSYLPNLITIIVIIFAFRYVLKFARFLKNEIEDGSLTLNGFYKDWANPTFQIIRVLIIAFMIVVIFPYLPGSDSQIFKGVSVFLGFLFTFGSMGSLSNVIAGLVLTYMRLFKINDRVKIGDVVGDVIEKSLLVTRIRTIKNEIISIPNSTVMSSHTINYSSDTVEKGLIMHTTVTLGYDVPWKKVHEALLTAANRTEMLLKEPTPFVLQTSLDDFYVSYQINAYTKEANKQASIYSKLHENIQDCCNEVGIEILSPHYRAARDGSMTTIPENYLDKDYKAPPFNININKQE